MKKLYAYLMSVLVTASAFAAPTAISKGVKTIEGTQTQPRQVERMASPYNYTGCKTKLKPTTLERVKAAPNKAADAQSKYDGDYILTVGDYLLQNATNSDKFLEAIVTVEDGKIYISCNDLFTDIVGDIDEATGTITFNNYYVGAITSASYAISFITLDLGEESPYGATITASYDETTETFIFDESAGFGFAVWQWPNAFKKNAVIKDAQEFNLDSDYFIGWYELYLFENLEKGSLSWTSLGMAKYYDGIMTAAEGIDEIYSWDVEVEQCDQNQGMYRMKPYAVKNPVGDALGLGTDEETTVLINATDPNKVFTEGDIMPYGVITICGLNTENGFNASYYGTYEDGVFVFPDESFAYEGATTWYIISTDGEDNMKVVLAGAEEKDYTIDVYTDVTISADNKWTLNITKGADVASVKYMVVPFEITYDVLTQYGLTFETVGTLAEGESVTLDPANANIVNIQMTESNFVSVLFASFDANGNQKKIQQISLPIVLDDVEMGWKTVGTMAYVDPFFTSIFDYSNESVEVQAMDDNSAMYRLVTPYVNSQFYDLAGHTVSMLINAVDPTWVEIPICFTGLDFGFGATAVGTCAALEFDKTTGTQQGFAAVTMKDNVVKFPVKTTFFHMPYLNDVGSWSYANSVAFDLTLPAITIDVTVKDQNDSAVKGAKVMIAGADEEILTDAEGKATLEVPFATGYFGKANIEVDGKAAEVQLNGAANEFSFVKESQTTGIDAVSSSDNEVPEYFNLQGIRVDRPEKGMYIKVQGGKTSKVSIR